MLLSQPRLKAHEAFVQNSLSFAKPQNKTSTVGVLNLKDIQFLTTKNIAIESPIITISDHLLTGKKAQRHGDAGNAATVEEWLDLPALISQPTHVLWDVSNESILWITPSLNSENPKEIMKLSVRSRDGVMQIVSIFKVSIDSILGNVKSGLYLDMR